MTTNIHLRGLSKPLLTYLKQRAMIQQMSMNKLILTLLQQSLGLEQERKPHIYHDLDKLAGTWSNKEAKEFLHTITSFEHIDKELWQ